MPEKPRFTLTGTYLNQKRPDREFSVEGPLFAPIGRKPILRMSWDFPQPKVRLSSTAVAQAIRESSLPEAVFFPDTCFLTTPLDVEVWGALLSRKMCLTPLVLQELTAFLDTPHCNTLVRDTLRDALSNGHSGIRALTEQEVRAMPGYRYYMQLLSLRKLKGVQFGNEISEKIGRAPTKQEFFSGFKQLVRGFDDRAFRLAWKGWEDREKHNYLADEQTVVVAALNALATGEESIILTRDHDLPEQFYKLIFLMDTHYRCMLFAIQHRMSNDNPYSQSMSDIEPVQLRKYLEERFHSEDGIVIAPQLPEPDAWNSVLPPPHGTVMTECWWFGDGPDDLQMCRMPFCADLNMNAIANIKESHDGLNSTEYGDRNCHIWPCPGLPLKRPMVVIAKDRKASVCGAEMRTTDMLHAVTSREGYSKVWTDGDEPVGG